MEIKDSRIDDGKAFDWGKTSEAYAKYREKITQSIATSIRKSFIRKLQTEDFVLKDSLCWTLELELVLFPAICTNMGRAGQEQIFRRNRLNRQNVWQVKPE